MLLLSSADFFSKLTFKKILSGILSECQTVLIQIRTDSVGPDLGPNCFQRFFITASRERVKSHSRDKTGE